MPTCILPFKMQLDEQFHKLWDEPMGTLRDTSSEQVHGKASWGCHVRIETEEKKVKSEEAAEGRGEEGEKIESTDTVDCRKSTSLPLWDAQPILPIFFSYSIIVNFYDWSYTGLYRSWGVRNE